MSSLTGVRMSPSMEKLFRPILNDPTKVDNHYLVQTIYKTAQQKMSKIRGSEVVDAQVQANLDQFNRARDFLIPEGLVKLKVGIQEDKVDEASKLLSERGIIQAGKIATRQDLEKSKALLGKQGLLIYEATIEPDDIPKAKVLLKANGFPLAAQSLSVSNLAALEEHRRLTGVQETPYNFRQSSLGLSDSEEKSSEPSLSKGERLRNWRTASEEFGHILALKKAKTNPLVRRPSVEAFHNGIDDIVKESPKSRKDVNNQLFQLYKSKGIVDYATSSYRKLGEPGKIAASQWQKASRTLNSEMKRLRRHPQALRRTPSEEQFFFDYQDLPDVTKENSKAVGLKQKGDQEPAVGNSEKSQIQNKKAKRFHAVLGLRQFVLQKEWEHAEDPKRAAKWIKLGQKLRLEGRELSKTTQPETPYEPKLVPGPLSLMELKQVSVAASKPAMSSVTASVNGFEPKQRSGLSKLSTLLLPKSVQSNLIGPSVSVQGASIPQTSLLTPKVSQNKLFSSATSSSIDIPGLNSRSRVPSRSHISPLISPSSVNSLDILASSASTAGETSLNSLKSPLGTSLESMGSSSTGSRLGRNKELLTSSRQIDGKDTSPESSPSSLSRRKLRSSSPFTVGAAGTITSKRNVSPRKADPVSKRRGFILGSPSGSEDEV